MEVLSMNENTLKALSRKDRLEELEKGNPVTIGKHFYWYQIWKDREFLFKCEIGTQREECVMQKADFLKKVKRQ